ncbi:hypothetical protein BU24DRAFT_283478 [Aaosphaeria arxii CBS 175.79]|uniref:Uncharacterized protein n=1 Tax=Aaosphaeria arxii CBS 175.79 TaxID=1450172 RepID=A0A6A5XGQ4_9PLEO|nr:uncharacterized protein BU24DRAFT_283478 [Aaosphaeria arxii CBS 175.79]KAF2011544.1 hypothetical protein BU24DRAFT_283478 [Aaosphaeria arxii CBS 175.79]
MTTALRPLSLGVGVGAPPRIQSGPVQGSKDEEGGIMARAKQEHHRAPLNQSHFHFHVRSTLQNRLLKTSISDVEARPDALSWDRTPITPRTATTMPPGTYSHVPPLHYPRPHSVGFGVEVPLLS